MAYFVKKTHNNKGLYLQIYFSYYNTDKKTSSHKSYKPIGYEHELIASGISDPLQFAQDQVDELNKQYREEKNKGKIKKISDTTPEKHIGYFPVKSIHDSLGIRKYIELLHSTTKQEFNLYDMMSALIYSRLVNPKSKLQTFENVIPTLFEEYDFSLNQLYEGLDFMGSEYQKIIEIYNDKINELYPFKTDVTFFDATNFYFEIDREDLFRRKGPSKEKRTDPIVGLGLLLDGNQIPMGMQLFPGNTSEVGILNQVIDNMKSRLHVEGRTIRVADKGLNCSNNIVDAISNGDGYLFSKSVKKLPETEKVWVKLDRDWVEVLDDKGQLAYKYKAIVDEFEYKIDTLLGKKKVALKEKRILTFNPKLARKQTREILKQIDRASNLCLSKAKKSEYGDCAKFVNFTPIDDNGEVTDNKIYATINEEAKTQALELAGYNLLVTSELSMSPTEIYDTYHKLWRIEESFRVMKSELDARPVFLQQQTTIQGHFLICYLSVLMFRIFQIYELKDQYGSTTIMNFIRNYKVFQESPRKFINMSRSSKFITEYAKYSDLPLDNYYLTSKDIKKILNH